MSSTGVSLRTCLQIACHPKSVPSAAVTNPSVFLLIFVSQAKRSISFPVSLGNHLTFCCAWRELLEHFRDAPIEVLFILRCTIRERAFGATPPNQLFRFRVEYVDNQCSLFVVLLGCGRVAEAVAVTAKSSPSPTATEADIVVVRLECLLRCSHLDRHDGNIATVVDLCPTLRR